MTPGDSGHDTLVGLLFAGAIVLVIYLASKPKRVVIKPLPERRYAEPPKLFKVRKNFSRLCNTHILVDRRKGTVAILDNSKCQMCLGGKL